MSENPQVNSNKGLGETKRFVGFKSKKPIIFIGVGAAVIIMFLAFVVGAHIYYNSRFYPNTWIADFEISGMKYDEAKQKLQDVYSNYELQINGRNEGKVVLSKEDIKYQVNIDSSLKEQYDIQHEDFTIFSMFEKKELDIDLGVSYDEQKLDHFLKKCELYAGSEKYPVTKPEDAKVVFSDDKKSLVIAQETEGNTLQYDLFRESVVNALSAGMHSVSLEEMAAYQKPQVKSDDEELIQELNTCNSMILRWITWKIDDGVQETLGPKKIYSWCKYKNGKVTFNKQAIRDWMELLCRKYKTVGATRTFTNHKGKEVQVAGGDYGWEMNYETMVSDLIRTLKKSVDSGAQQAYLENPGTDTKKAITTKLKPVYLTTAYQRDTVEKQNDFDTENFTEISLKDQKVYVIRNGKVKFSCKLISGLPVTGRQTRTGAYYIKEHQTHRVLVGEDYKTPVDYWVRITWTGTGFHAAPWQPWSRWTKDLYKTRGSHGCLNLEPKNAKKIYELTKYKEIVFIY